MGLGPAWLRVSLLLVLHVVGVTGWSSVNFLLTFRRQESIAYMGVGTCDSSSRRCVDSSRRFAALCIHD